MHGHEGGHSEAGCGRGENNKLVRKRRPRRSSVVSRLRRPEKKTWTTVQSVFLLRLHRQERSDCVRSRLANLILECWIERRIRICNASESLLPAARLFHLSPCRPSLTSTVFLPTPLSFQHILP